MQSFMLKTNYKIQVLEFGVALIELPYYNLTHVLDFSDQEFNIKKDYRVRCDKMCIYIQLLMWQKVLI